ncbi:ATP-binding cassette domain-containing protein [Bacteroidia bacterium]|nr:ATP-binding cassette domain-containing protein [Bacteroidia bacterium]MDA9110849.1 ATP-binding cassette domain-containing protein [Bacteroidia bacterium]
MSIEINQLTKVYGEQKAINNISFSIGAGEVVGFLGPNGAGKSTTMKILSGFIPATSGTAKVMGIDVAKDPLAVKKRIGYLPELNPLYDDMFIVEYLQFNADIYQLKNAKQEIERVINKTGLSVERHKKISQLSKGYRQRVGLAQALLNNPDVLILDEPTSGLDPNQMSEIRQLIANLSKEKTILLSTHIMQEVEAMCNRVIIINRGSIVAHDTVSNVKQQISSGNKEVYIRFRDVVDAASLLQLQGVKKVESAAEGGFTISANQGADLAAILFKFAVESNTVIVEQKEIKESLEAVFQELTKNV